MDRPGHNVASKEENDHELASVIIPMFEGPQNPKKFFYVRAREEKDATKLGQVPAEILQSGLPIMKSIAFYGIEQKLKIFQGGVKRKNTTKACCTQCKLPEGRYLTMPRLPQKCSMIGDFVLTQINEKPLEDKKCGQEG